MTILCSFPWCNAVVVTAVAAVAEKSSDEKNEHIKDRSSPASPVRLITRDDHGAGFLVRWTSSELDNSSKTELMSVGVSVSDDSQCNLRTQVSFLFLPNIV